MTHCICGNEDSVAMIGDAKIQLGQKCYVRLIKKGTEWDAGIKLHAVREALKQ